MSRHRKRRGGVSSGDAIAWRRASAWASGKKAAAKTFASSIEKLAAYEKQYLLQ
jgi:hypothetical protein